MAMVRLWILVRILIVMVIVVAVVISCPHVILVPNLSMQITVVVKVVMALWRINVGDVACLVPSIDRNHSVSSCIHSKSGKMVGYRLVVVVAVVVFEG